MRAAQAIGSILASSGGSCRVTSHRTFTRASPSPFTPPEEEQPQHLLRARRCAESSNTHTVPQLCDNPTRVLSRSPFYRGENQVPEKIRWRSGEPRPVCPRSVKRDVPPLLSSVPARLKHLLSAIGFILLVPLSLARDHFLYLGLPAGPLEHTAFCPREMNPSPCSPLTPTPRMAQLPLWAPASQSRSQQPEELVTQGGPSPSPA